MTIADNANPLGPLATLVGVWEGTAGTDVAPADPDRRSGRTSKFRERMTFDAIGQVNNHDQILQGLRYFTTTWRLGEENAFHQEVGYWLWDAAAKQVVCCFVVPRGVTVSAGGPAEPDARAFEIVAEVGSPIFGICSNPYLDREFRTVRFTMKVTVHDANSFSYEQDTVLEIPGHATFHHTDANTLLRVG